MPIDGRAKANGSLNWMGSAFWMQACDVLGAANPVNREGGAQQSDTGRTEIDTLCFAMADESGKSIL